MSVCKHDPYCPGHGPEHVRSGEPPYDSECITPPPDYTWPPTPWPCPLHDQPHGLCLHCLDAAMTESEGEA